ncbi:hydantoinase B/oxoprolinase family protein [Chloroflexota bacterium]
MDEKDSHFVNTGYCYGLENLELIEEDPVKFMRFQMKLVAACINTREQAKLITANPVALLMGELLFMLANPEGDCIAASYGLIGHVQSFPFIIRAITNLGFEDDPGIREGDIFATNDALYGAPHNADNFTWIPVFYNEELIAWTVGLNHISDVGALQPGNMSQISPNTFTDGFIYPPLKTGENFKQHKWWELFWKRRTRTGAFNVLDDKMRVAGAVSLHDKVREVVDEFGIDYFRKGLREILERERRLLIRRIMTQAVPGIYHFLRFSFVSYRGVASKMFPNSDRNWLIHLPVEFQVLSDGRMVMDLNGLTSEADFHCNTYEPAVRMTSSIGTWPMFAHTQTINTSLLYVTHFNIPLGSMFNPQNPFAGTAMGLGEAARTMFVYLNCLSYAYFARGFLEECFPQESGGIGYGLDGKMADGFTWAGGDMPFIACTGTNALPYKDGEVCAFCLPNPESDLGEIELCEFVQPTNLNMGRRVIPNYCGHGRFRGGLGMGITHLILDPGQKLTIAAYASTSGLGQYAMGIAGGYPGSVDLICFVHNTNMRENISNGLPYPRSFVEVRDFLRDGKLKAENVEVYRGPSPNIECKDGDIFSFASNATGGWGDPLDRLLELAEEDVYYGWLTADVVRTVYGIVTDDEGKVKEAESHELRQQMRERRKSRSVSARKWWEKEREMILRKDFPEDIYNMYADCLKYERFRRAFMGVWQLPDDYQL